MRVLVACEFSGVVRDAFTAAGHYAVSCDLMPSETPGIHFQGDVRDILRDNWDLMIAHPPCTRLSLLYFCNKDPNWDEVYAARDFVLQLWTSPIAHVAVENPVGKLNSLWQLPSQMIQPWAFGHPYTKKTCLWLRGLPPLMATAIVPAQFKWKEAFRHRTPGQWRDSKTASRTFPGIAAAMADQWGSL